MAHSPLSPSRFKLYRECSGTLVGKGGDGSSSPDSIASIEGSTAHFLLQTSVFNRVSPIEISTCPDLTADASKWLDGIMASADNNDEVKEFAKDCFQKVATCSFESEMRQHILPLWERVMAFIADGYECSSELNVSLEAWFGHTLCDGTADLVLHKMQGGLLHLLLIDLKYGQGVRVKAENNPALMLYAAGAVMAAPAAEQMVIDMVISQPRLGVEWDEWSISYEQLYRAIMDEFRPVVAHAKAVLEGSEPARYKPSAATCQFCWKRSSCHFRSQAAIEAINLTFGSAGAGGSVTVDSLSIQNLDGAAIGGIIDKIPLIKAFLSDVEEEANRRLSAEEEVVGYKLVQGRSSRKWAKKEDEVIEILHTAGIECTEASLRSPAKMDKLALSSEQKEIVKNLVNTSYGKPIMVHIEDARASLSAKQSFQSYFN